MSSAIALVATPLAQRYLGQLCAHFAHKLSVSQNESSREIRFSIGSCSLTAEADMLRLRLDCATEADLTILKDVVDRHLLRFAFREPSAIF